VAEETFNVAKAFAPFSATESHDIRKYWERARQIGQCSFFREGQGVSLQVKAGVEAAGDVAGITQEVKHAGEDSLTHMLVLMRPLYSTKDHRFHDLHGTLRVHALQRDSNDSRIALEMLDEYRTDHRKILAQGPLILKRVPGQVSPRRILEDYLKAFLHMEDHKLPLWRHMPEMAEFMMVSTASRLSGLYVQFSSFANAVLHEPSLVPSDFVSTQQLR